jgi:hypothetical protein
MQSGEETIPFAVNVNTEESELNFLEKEEALEVLKTTVGGTLNWIEEEKPIRSSIFGTRLTTDLTNPLIFMTLLFLLLEMVIAGRWKSVKKEEE